MPGFAINGGPMADRGPAGMLQQMAGGYCVARCLHVVVELGVADALGEKPVDAGTLAEAVGAHRDALARALRLLSAHGVFELHRGRFRHTAASRLLREDHPESMRPLVRLFGLPLCWDAYGVLGHSLRTGRPSTELLQPQGLEGWLGHAPEAANILEAAKSAYARRQVAAVLAAYDFSGFEMIGALDGCGGRLLRAVLQACPNTKGILLGASPPSAPVEPQPRMTCQDVDCFRDPLPSCGAYLLMDALQEWDDDQAIAAMKAVRRAAPSGATLLLVEAVMSDVRGADWSHLLDLHRLALFGGRQRTRDECAYLLRSAGFLLVREVETPGEVSILESRAT